MSAYVLLILFSEQDSTCIKEISFVLLFADNFSNTTAIILNVLSLQWRTSNRTKVPTIVLT